jgi:cbb3-type cytochrome oxidase subunit 3
MTLELFRGLMTGVLLVSFCALVAWAWSRARQEAFDAAARSPLEDAPLEDEGTAS